MRASPIDKKLFAQRAAGTVLIVISGVVAGVTQRLHAYSCGHDFDFHLLSWFEALSSWHRGLFYPHWAMSPNYGAGEPRFVFYPPLTWMMGAGLRLIMQWGWVPLVMVWTMFAAAGLATRALARELVSEAAATLAGCTTIFSGYALFTGIERSAYGELTGGFWIPLLLLFALRDRNADAGAWRRALDGSAWRLALVVAGVWLSNVPLGVMACYLLAAVAAAAVLLRKSWAPAIRACVAAALGIGLAGLYLIPATWEQRWVDVAQAISDPGSRIENSWLFAQHADPALDLHDSVLLKASIIAASMIGVAMVCVGVCWLRGKFATKREWWIVLAVIPVVVLLLQLPVSLPVWNLVPKLRLLQFPWRWLVVVEAPMAILFAAALWPARRWRQALVTVVCTVLFVAAAAVADKVFHQICDAEDSISGMLYAYVPGDGFEGTDEYEPPGADDSIVPQKLPGACLVSDVKAQLATPDPDENPIWEAGDHSCEQTFVARWPAREEMTVTGDVSRAGLLILKLRSYPAWRVTVNGHEATALPKRDDGLMTVPVAQGPVKIDVSWRTTGDEIAGRWCSAVSLLLLVGLGWREFAGKRRAG